MRSLLLSVLSLGASLHASDFVVHEWGTFTAVSASNGTLLTGLEVEEERLPAFVYSHAGFAPAAKGWERPVVGVTIKMETPVIYFYSTRPLTVRVDVGFRGGSISQWYPDRTGGEQLPAPMPVAQRAALPPVDFARGYQGAATWQVDVLPAGAPVTMIPSPKLETPQWPRARVPSASRVRGSRGEVEGFIFYRGLGNFALPLRVRATADGAVTLHNDGREPIPFALIYERRSVHAEPRVWWNGSLAAGETTSAQVVGPGGTAAMAMIAERLPQELAAAGLTGEEARAMLATWHESYFERPGLRVFWIVPRAFTDAVLPITITPRPAQLERVLVGRTEVLTPAFEAELRKEFAADGGTRWAGDRYARAYRERVKQLDAVVGVAPPPPVR